MSDVDNDLQLYGIAFLVDGQRVAPDRVTVRKADGWHTLRPKSLSEQHAQLEAEWVKLRQMHEAYRAAQPSPTSSAEPVSATATSKYDDQFKEYRRGLREAFHFANMIAAGRNRENADLKCTEIVRTLASLANGDPDLPTAERESAALSTLTAAPIPREAATVPLMDEFLHGLYVLAQACSAPSIFVKHARARLAAAPASNAADSNTVPRESEGAK